MRNRQSLMENKAALLELLKPLGFTDPDPDYLELVHEDTQISISCRGVSAENLIQRIFKAGKDACRVEVSEKVREALRG